MLLLVTLLPLPANTCRFLPPAPAPLQCHKAKNLLPSGGSQPTQTARAVVEIQVGGRVWGWGWGR